MIKFCKEHHWQIILLLVFILLFALRLINLGYSDYNTDEATVVGRLARENGEFSLAYLLQQRKGPMQWLITLVPYLFLKKITPEFWFRLPFAIFNTLSLYFLYKFLLLETKNKWASLAAAFLVGTNGFMVAFGRFLQYQSLNLFFSLLSMYFYARYLHLNKKKSFYIGSVAFALSILSHWDAVFATPYIIYVLVKKFDLRIILANAVLLAVLVLPFIMPFIANLKENSQDFHYFSGRLGLRQEFDLSEVRFRTNVYNPLFFSTFVTAFLLVSALYFKKYLPFWLWFLASLLAFLVFIKVPGTHVYNLIVPTTILATFGYIEIAKLFKNEYKIVPIGLFIAVLCFFYYQSYILFVDYGKEYPWEQEKIFRYETKEYDHGDITNHLIGFTHGRNWAEAADFAHDYLKSKSDGEEYTFVTNENKTIAGLYLGLPYGESDKFLAFGVKNPYNFATDYKFSQLSDKETIYKVEDATGNTLMRVYEYRKDGQ